MAWNRSNSGEAASQPLNKDGTSSNKRVGTRFPTLGTRHYALGTLAVVAATAVWFFCEPSKPSKHPKPSKPSSLIKEVTPNIAPTNVVQQKKWPKWWNVPDDWDKPYPPQAYRADGSLKQNSRYVKVTTNETPLAQMSIEERTFSNVADQDIASMLVMEPGSSLVGEAPVYDKSFVKLFLKSLETPIVIDENDTPTQQELKKAVIETKKDLKARYDAGEDIAEIMNAAYREQKELSLYRQELEEQVAQLRADNKGKFTDKDVKDLIDAANAMLKDRGCKELEATEIFKHRMEMKAARLAARKERE